MINLQNFFFALQLLFLFTFIKNAIFSYDNAFFKNGTCITDMSDKPCLFQNIIQLRCIGIFITIYLQKAEYQFLKKIYYKSIRINLDVEFFQHFFPKNYISKEKSTKFGWLSLRKGKVAHDIWEQVWSQQSGLGAEINQFKEKGPHIPQRETKTRPLSSHG